MNTNSTRATASLNEKVGPIKRGERYEDPLQDALESKGYGSVDGGGTMTSKEGEIMFADVEIELTDITLGIPFVIEFLEKQGAPKGSRLLIRLGDTDKEIFFGIQEGLGIYLDGVNLPDEVYRDCDSNVVWEEFTKLLGAEGEIRNHWHGPKETAFYIYGPSFQRMMNLIAPFLDSYPLCRGARVEQITPP